MNKVLPKIILAVCSCCIVALLPLSTAHGQMRLGVVDVLKTLNDSSIGLEAKHGLSEFIRSRQEIMDKKEKEIEELREGIAMLPEQAAELRERREAELGRLIELYTGTAGRLQEEIEGEQARLTQQITEKLKAIVEEIGEVEDYSLIIDGDEELVLFCDKSLQIEIK